MSIKKACFFTFWLFLVFLAFRPGNSFAQAPEKRQKPITVRMPDPEKLKALQNDRDFQYGLENVRPSSFSILDRFTRWLRKLLSPALSTASFQNFWKYVMYAFAIVTTIFVILKLLKIDFTGLFSRQPMRAPVAYETHEENIHEMDFQALIEEAVQQQDFRKAIRLSYLNVLKNLTDRELINWSPGKTNRSYVKELKNSNLRNPFELITGTFEYVWYGGSALTETNFLAARQLFSDFNQQVKRQA